MAKEMNKNTPIVWVFFCYSWFIFQTQMISDVPRPKSWFSQDRRMNRSPRTRRKNKNLSELRTLRVKKWQSTGSPWTLPNHESATYSYWQNMTYMIKLVSSSIGSITEEHFENGEKSVNKLKVVSLLVLLALTMSMLAACGSSAPAGVSNLVFIHGSRMARQGRHVCSTDTRYMTRCHTVAGRGSFWSSGMRWTFPDRSATPFLSNNVVWSTASGANRLYAQTNSRLAAFRGQTGSRLTCAE